MLVLPKLDSSCILPMPKLGSYLLSHAVHFLDVPYLHRVQMAWFCELGDVFQLWIVQHRVVVSASPDNVTTILGRP